MFDVASLAAVEALRLVVLLVALWAGAGVACGGSSRARTRPVTAPAPLPSFHTPAAGGPCSGLSR